MSLLVKVGVDNTRALTGLAQVESAVKRIAGSIGTAFLGGLTFEGLIEGTKQLIENLAKIKDVSKAFGLGAEEFQRFQFAIEQTGGSVDSLGMALKNLSSARASGLSDPGGDAAKSFSMLGISVEQLKQSSPGDLFSLVRNRLSEVGDEADRSALAQKLLGRAFLSLAPSLSATSDEFRKLTEAASVASQTSVDAAKKISDAWGATVSTIKEFSSSGIDALEPYLLAIAGITNAFISLYKNINVLNNPLSKIAEAFYLFKEKGPAAGFEALGKFFNDVGSQFRKDIQKSLEISKGMTGGKGESGSINRKVDVSGLRSDTQRLEDAAARKAIRDKDELLRAQQKYDEAAAQNAAASMDANEKIGQKNAEIVEMQTRLNGLQKDSAEYYNLAAEILRKQTELTQLKNEALQDSVRLQQEEARAAEHLADTKRRMEDIEAKRAGGSATEDLLKKRAKEAINNYKETGKADDRLAAVQARQDYENAVQGRISKDPLSKFYYSSPEAAARQAGDALGKIAPLSEAMNDKASINSQADMPKEQTILKISDDVRKAVEKLDDILRSSGSFGY